MCSRSSLVKVFACLDTLVLYFLRVCPIHLNLLCLCLVLVYRPINLEMFMRYILTKTWSSTKKIMRNKIMLNFSKGLIEIKINPQITMNHCCHVRQEQYLGHSMKSCYYIFQRRLPGRVSDKHCWL